MRVWLSGLAILAATASSNLPAQAQSYPWCAQYSGGDTGGASNCGFTSFEQCMATVRGMGGFCNANTQYSGSTAGPRMRRHYSG